MSEPLEIRTGVGGGNEYYWRWHIEVGENWVSGCDNSGHDDGTWERLQREAAVIASALAPADTVERQMALAVLAGDSAAALALADRLCETRSAPDDAARRLVEAGPDLLAAAKNALETMYRGDFTNGVTSPMGDIDEGDVMAGHDMDRLREAIRKAEGA